MDETKNFNTVEGVIYAINNTITKKTAKGDFYIRSFILELRNEYNGKTFTELPEFWLKQDKVGNIDYFEVGDKVVVGFRITGREWKKPETGEVKYFTELACYSIKGLQQDVTSDGKVDASTATPTTNNTSLLGEGDNTWNPFDKDDNDGDDDLPF